MKIGEQVRIRGAKGEIFGVVLDVRAVSELPSLSKALVIEVVQQLFAELLIDGVAMIAYDYALYDGSLQRVSFAALHNEHGWHDLRGQHLTIEPLGRAVAV